MSDSVFSEILFIAAMACCVAVVGGMAVMILAMAYSEFEETRLGQILIERLKRHE